jgi:ubiquinone/menaquinone biosynthesis C-methylase UbiE
MPIGAGQTYWDEHARKDPLWAILADPSKTGGRWDLSEFFATGVNDVRRVMARVERWGIPGARRTALDFGCGVGRLTQALADQFEKVYGVDVSPAMLEHARRFNRKGQRCEYVWNPESNLRQFPDRSCDLIYSRLTLQHIQPRHVRSYVKEFLRLLVPGGLLLFQLPSRPLCPYPGIAGKLLFRLGRIYSLMTPAMYMNGIAREQVIALLEKNGGRVVEVEPNTDAGAGFESYTYAVTVPLER